MISANGAALILPARKEIDSTLDTTTKPPKPRNCNNIEAMRTKATDRLTDPKGSRAKKEKLTERHLTEN